MKSVIYDMASEAYEMGHPFPEEDVLDWFESEEDEDILVELVQEAANYYFVAFDEIREKDNTVEERFHRSFKEHSDENTSPIFNRDISKQSFMEKNF